jgi:hypothetical protein
MFREGQNSKAAIDAVQQDDDGAVGHFQQQAPGQALCTSSVNLTTINSVVFRSVGPAIPWFTVGAVVSVVILIVRPDARSSIRKGLGILNLLCTTL